MNKGAPNIAPISPSIASRLCGLLLAFLEFVPDLKKLLDIGALFGKDYGTSGLSKILALIAFGVITAVLLRVGMRKSAETQPPEGPDTSSSGENTRLKEP